MEIYGSDIRGGSSMKGDILKRVEASQYYDFIFFCIILITVHTRCEDCMCNK
jgi:hypothetical protein